MDTHFLEFRIKKDYLKGDGKKDDMKNAVRTAVESIFPKANVVFTAEEDVTMLFVGPGMKLLCQVHKSDILAVNLDQHDIKDQTFEEKVEKLSDKLHNCEFYLRPYAGVDVTIPAIKRGREFLVYDRTPGLLSERDFEEVVFNEMSLYQHVQIMKSKQYGNILYLDGYLNMAESDLEYTKAITGYDAEDYCDKTVLILGGGDGGVLHHLRDRGPKMITMIDIDQMVIDAAKKHLRGVCHDALDSLSGPNYEVIINDCVAYLEKYVTECRKFDYIINDLTDIPVSPTPVGDHWDFMRKILTLSMKVLADDGKYYTQGNSQFMSEALAMYEEQLDKLGCPVKFERIVACVPSYLENWVFYKIWKI